MAFLSIVLVQVIHAAIFRDLLEGYKYVDRGAPFGLVYGPLLFFLVIALLLVKACNEKKS